MVTLQSSVELAPTGLPNRALQFPNCQSALASPFPPESVHSRISFSELPYATTVASPTVTVMASNYLPGSLSQRPSHSRAAVVTGSVMAVEVQRLQTKVVVLSCCSGLVAGVIRAADVAY
jgi:hypothetical protein